MIETISDGLKVNLQKFNGEIYRAEEIMYSKGALQYRIDLEKYPDLAYRTDTCENGGESTDSITTLGSLQGTSKERFPGCVKFGGKLRFVYLLQAEERNFFHPIFTQPGKHSLEIPCMIFALQRSAGRR